MINCELIWPGQSVSIYNLIIVTAGQAQKACIHIYAFHGRCWEYYESGVSAMFRWSNPRGKDDASSDQHTETVIIS